MESTNKQFQIMYFGDNKVYIGKPFNITCIIGISESIEWLKDDQLLKKHQHYYNNRGDDDDDVVVDESLILQRRNIKGHNDDHLYVLSENSFSGIITKCNLQSILF